MMYFASFFTLVICLGIGAQAIDTLKDEYSSLGTKADFYELDFLQGSSNFIQTDGECKNLPVRWHKKPRSVDTRGTCVSVCDDKDCTGECIRVYPAHGEQQLSKVNFAKKIVSMQGCFV